MKTLSENGAEKARSLGAMPKSFSLLPPYLILANICSFHLLNLAQSTSLHSLEVIGDFTCFSGMGGAEIRWVWVDGWWVGSMQKETANVDNSFGNFGQRILEDFGRWYPSFLSFPGPTVAHLCPWVGQPLAPVNTQSLRPMAELSTG